MRDPTTVLKAHNG